MAQPSSEPSAGGIWLKDDQNMIDNGGRGIENHEHSADGKGDITFCLNSAYELHRSKKE